MADLRGGRTGLCGCPSSLLPNERETGTGGGTLAAAAALTQTSTRQPHGTSIALGHRRVSSSLSL